MQYGRGLAHVFSYEIKNFSYLRPVVLKDVRLGKDYVIGLPVFTRKTKRTFR